MRIVSLLPSASEIVAALGLEKQLVGISHDCDFPPSVVARPRVTACEVADNEMPGNAVNDWVSVRLSQGQPLFAIDATRLAELRPDLILTQGLCDVCAPSYDTVADLAAKLPSRPHVLTLDAFSLEGILDNIQQVADAVGMPERGTMLVRALRNRIEYVSVTIGRPTLKPRVAFIEWLEPAYCSGHWTPQLVEIAGGVDTLGQKAAPSTRKTWRDVEDSAPDLLVIACCGHRVAPALKDWTRVKQLNEVRVIPAVRGGRVFLVDGSAYFNRPGPRIVDSLEILAEILHPEIFSGKFPDRGILRCP
ncbi:MAG: ABC transporter substrate-binding protein [Pseudomonadota bacterium]